MGPAMGVVLPFAQFPVFGRLWEHGLQLLLAADPALLLLVVFFIGMQRPWGAIRSTTEPYSSSS